MVYKLLNENVQNIIDKKLQYKYKLYFNYVLNELKYTHIYNKYYLSDNCSIFINNYNIGWYIIPITHHKQYVIYIKYGNITKNLNTCNALLFKNKKLKIIQNIYKWNINNIL